MKSPLNALLVTLAALCMSAPHAAVPVTPSAADESSVMQLEWLKAANYSALEQYYSEQQRDFEAGRSSDDVLFASFRKLYESSADNEKYFDAWVAAYPSSYSARLARGAYLYRMGFSARGDSYIDKTPRRQLNAMTNWMDRARPDLGASLALTEKPYLSALYLLNVAIYDGTREEVDHWFDVGMRIDPANTMLRYRYMSALRPRWHGSYDEMRAFLQQCRQQHLAPAFLAKLEMVIHADLAEDAMTASDTAGSFDEWRQVIDLAQIAGETASDEAVIAYTRAAQDLNRPADVQRGLQQLSGRQFEDAWSLSHAGWAYAMVNRNLEAWPLLLKAAELNDSWAQFTVGRVIYAGDPTLQMNADQAAGLVWIKRSAEQCQPDARAFLGAHRLPLPSGCAGTLAQTVSSAVQADDGLWVRLGLGGVLIVLIVLRCLTWLRARGP